MSSPLPSDTRATQATALKSIHVSNLVNRAAAVFEAVGVLVIGNLLAFYLIPLLGLRPLGPILESALKEPEPDFSALSLGFLETKLIQYGCLLLLAFGVGWWRRHLGPRHYGITTAGRSVCGLARLGI